MRHDEYQEHVIDFTNEMTEVTEKKNHDYSVRLDAMDNFKLIGEMLGISPTLVWSVLWMKHVTAVINHMAQGKTLKSETIHGRFIDLANYAMLGDALVQDLASSPHEFRKAYHDQHGSEAASRPVHGDSGDVQGPIPINRTDGQSHDGPDAEPHPRSVAERTKDLREPELRGDRTRAVSDSYRDVISGTKRQDRPVYRS